MRIDKSGQYDFAGTVDLGDLLAILPQPGIAQGILRGADRNDLAAETEDRAISMMPSSLRSRLRRGPGLPEAERSESSWLMLAKSSGGEAALLLFSEGIEPSKSKLQL